MLDFFKKKKNINNPEVTTNDFLSVENSAFNTETDSSNGSFSDNFDYSSLVYQEPVYDVPKYKASNLSSMGIVLDSDAIGFDKTAINPNIKTIEYETNDEQDEKNIIVEEPVQKSVIEPVTPIVSAEPIVETKDSKSIFNNRVKEDSKKVSIANNKDDDIEKFSIFGSNDGVTNLNNYSKDGHYVEEKKELIKEVEYTKEGYKICPNCGAILNPNAPVCFMCSKSFILKK